MRYIKYLLISLCVAGAQIHGQDINPWSWRHWNNVQPYLWNAASYVPPMLVGAGLGAALGQPYGAYYLPTFTGGALGAGFRYFLEPPAFYKEIEKFTQLLLEIKSSIRHLIVMNLLILNESQQQKYSELLSRDEVREGVANVKRSLSAEDKKVIENYFKSDLIKRDIQEKIANVAQVLLNLLHTVPADAQHLVLNLMDTTMALERLNAIKNRLDQMDGSDGDYLEILLQLT